MESQAILALVAIYSMGVITGVFVGVGALKMAQSFVQGGGVKPDDLVKLQKGLETLAPAFESIVTTLKKGT